MNHNDAKLRMVKQYEMEFLLNNSNLPERLKKDIPLVPEKVDVAAFVELSNIQKNIKRFVKAGGNMYIYSYNFGNGKTTWGAKLLLEYFDKIALGNQLRVRGIFVNVSTLFAQMKKTISYPDPYVNQLLEDLQKADLVVWDDISIAKMSEYEVEQLTIMIDVRVGEGKSNIFTGNLDGDELLQSLGGRLYSRVFRTSKVIRFEGVDRRSNAYD